MSVLTLPVSLHGSYLESFSGGNLAQSLMRYPLGEHLTRLNFPTLTQRTTKRDNNRGKLVIFGSRKQ